MKLIKQSVLLILSFGAVYIWQQTPASQYTIPVLGFLIFLYLLLSARKKGSGLLTLGGEGPWGVLILNTIILLLIFATGVLDSNLFFLLYFLGFGVSFVFEPGTVFVFILLSFALFLPEALKTETMENLIKIGSLLLISPLAFFFGKEFRREEKQEEKLIELKERSKDAADTISSDVEEVLQDEKDVLKSKDVEKLNEILEETEDLRAESKEK